MLDTVGRVFTMGETHRGRTGLADPDLEEIIKMPTQVTLGLPEPCFDNKVIHVNTGGSHSCAVTRAGEIYSWGDGSQQKLGIGYVPITHTTPDKMIPSKVITSVFDHKQIISLSCGRR